MRLTHKVKYKDKRKNREPMAKIRNKLFEIENLLEEFNINDINELRTCLENEQKGTEYFENWWNKRFEEILKPKVEALKIIKAKNINVRGIINSLNLEYYIDHCMPRHSEEPTQKEYNLLKVVLL